jgi:hypothetical protein
LEAIHRKKIVAQNRRAAAGVSRSAAQICAAGNSCLDYHPSGDSGATLAASVDGPLPNDTITYA